MSDALDLERTATEVAVAAAKFAAAERKVQSAAKKVGGLRGKACTGGGHIGVAGGCAVGLKGESRASDDTACMACMACNSFAFVCLSTCPELIDLNATQLDYTHQQEDQVKVAAAEQAR